MIFQSFNWLFFVSVTLLSFFLRGRLRHTLFYTSGIYFIHHYSPLSLAILIPVALLITAPYIFRESEKQNQVNGLVWISAWLLYGTYVYYMDLTNHRYFPYEILLLGAYNLARFYHILIDLNYLRKKGPDWDQLFAYLFFPPLLFCGPIEKFQEFLNFSKNDYKTNYKQVAYFLILAITQAAIAEFCDIFLTHPDADLSTIGKIPLILYILGIGWEIHFRLSSYLNFSRGFAWFMGFEFSKPNFQKPYSARSVAGFWSRWNMSLSRWTRQYLFYGNIESFTFKRVAFVLIMFWCLVGILHGLNWHYFLWGVSMGMVILVNFAYMFARYHLEWLIKFDLHYFPTWIKRALTITWIHLSCVLLVPDCEILIDAIKRNLGL